jgi:hypothetical protein
MDGQWLKVDSTSLSWIITFNATTHISRSEILLFSASNVFLVYNFLNLYVYAKRVANAALSGNPFTKFGVAVLYYSSGGGIPYSGSWMKIILLNGQCR